MKHASCRRVKASYHELQLRYDRREKVSRALGVMEMKQAVAVRFIVFRIFSGTFMTFMHRDHKRGDPVVTVTKHVFDGQEHAVEMQHTV